VLVVRACGGPNRLAELFGRVVWPSCLAETPGPRWEATQAGGLASTAICSNRSGRVRAAVWATARPSWPL